MQTTQRLLSSIAALSAAAMLAACASPGYQQGGNQYPANPGAYPSNPGYASMGTHLRRTRLARGADWISS